MKDKFDLKTAMKAINKPTEIQENKSAEKTDHDKKASSSNIEELLQRQVCHEFDNERLYLSMALWCDYHGYPETAAFFSKHTLEERRHGMDFINHMLMRHIKVKPPCEHEQPADYEDLTDIFKRAIKRERETTEMIGEIHAEALKTNDLALTIAGRYLQEQLEEEQLFMSLYNLYKMCNGNAIDFEAEVSKIKSKDKYKLGTI
jgi:ferritin